MQLRARKKQTGDLHDSFRAFAVCAGWKSSTLLLVVIGGSILFSFSVGDGDCAPRTSRIVLVIETSPRTHRPMTSKFTGTLQHTHLARFFASCHSVACSGWFRLVKARVPSNGSLRVFVLESCPTGSSGVDQMFSFMTRPMQEFRPAPANPRWVYV